MAGNLQPLVSNQPIVKNDGTPTDYFIRWAQQKQIDITGSITAEQAQELIDAWAALRDVTAGVGLAGGGNLSADIELHLNAFLDTLLDVVIASPTNGQVLQYNSGAGMWTNADVPAPYRLSTFFTTALTAAEILFLHTFTSAVTYPINFAGSKGSCGIAPAAATTLPIAKNGANIGTVNISTGGAVTFTLAAATTFAISDVLSITGNATVSTAANVSISLLG